MKQTKRFLATKSGATWSVRDRDPATEAPEWVATGLTQQEAQTMAAAMSASPPSQSGTDMRRACMSLDDWARDLDVTVLPNGDMVRWSCNGNPYSVARDGGRYVAIAMPPAVRAELDARGIRRPGDPQPRAYMPYSYSLEVRATEAMIRAQNSMPAGADDEEIDEAGHAAYEAVYESARRH